VTTSHGGAVVKCAHHISCWADGFHLWCGAARACWGSSVGVCFTRLLERALGGALMPTDSRYHAPSNLSCPKCGQLMRLVAIEPSASEQGADKITYKCDACNHEEKHVRKVGNGYRPFAKRIGLLILVAAIVAVVLLLTSHFVGL
jgi:hypothetical protein